MSEDATPRDKVWAEIIKLDKNRFTVSDIKEEIPPTSTELAYGKSAAPDAVSEETIRRVLRAGADLGVIDHEPGSKYYQKKMTVEVDVEAFY